MWLTAYLSFLKLFVCVCVCITWIGICSLSRILVAAQILKELPQTAEPFLPNLTVLPLTIHGIAFICEWVSECFWLYLASMIMNTEMHRHSYPAAERVHISARNPYILFSCNSNGIIQWIWLGSLHSMSLPRNLLADRKLSPRACKNIFLHPPQVLCHFCH